MANIPIRGLSAQGILRDPLPSSLDLTSWSGGANVRFHETYAERAPVWRTLADALPLTNPAYCAGVSTEVAGTWILLIGPGERLWKYTGGSITEVTPTSGWLNYVASVSFTTTQLGDVVYVNRPTQQPFYYAPGSSEFAALTGWGSTWTCRSLRAFGDYLVALNVTKGSQSFPNLVKTSDLALYGQAPGSWDQTDLTTEATENPLEKLTTPLVDGVTLRGDMILYTSDQLWRMYQVNTSDVFNYEAIGVTGGMISPNCGAEIDGENYVFGPNDLYKHDGVNKVSLIDERNRNYVFRKLVRGQSWACFVAYLPMYDSVVFAYPTTNPEAYFQGVRYCNQAAVLDRSRNTWSFIDLPDVANIAQVYGATSPTYETITGTYSGTPSLTYASLDADTLGIIVGCSTEGAQVTKSRLLVYDFVDKGLQTTLPAITEVNPPAVLERTGIDLDQLAVDIKAYKLVRGIYPLMRCYGGAKPQFQVGSQMTAQGDVTWSAAKEFDPTTDGKVDVMQGGRFFGVRITLSDLHDFETSGFDVDVVPNGTRG